MTYAVNIRVNSEPIRKGSVITVTQSTGNWTYDVQTPMEQLCDAVADLRDAFAEYAAAWEGAA